MSAIAETGLFLDGLRCAGCVARVEQALRALPGVEEAAVSHTSHRALVRYDPERLTASELVSAVEGLGYRAQPFDPERLERPAVRAARAALVRVLVAAFLAGNVMMVAVALYLGESQGMEPATRDALRWLSVGLSLPAVTWCAAPFWAGAWGGLRRGRLPMDVPVVLGVGTAFGASVAGTLAGASSIYADSAAMIVFLILLGRTLERAARARASGAVERLVALAPPRAWRIAADGSVEDVPAEVLRRGDRVRVAPGGAFPADGRIVGAPTEVDESMLTGESVPVLRRRGDPVVGGTTNVLAETEVEVLAEAGRGTLARLVALLERAEAERPRVQILADRVAAVFAPAVLLVAGGAALARGISGAPPLEVALTAAAVLIVACPCALGLATPAAVTAALGRAARAGILVKSGEVLERCAGVRAAVLDKTGTLTEGRLAVERVEPAPGTDANTVLAAAAFAEGVSGHPVAVALRDAARAAGAELRSGEPDARETHPGLGVAAHSAGERVAVGSLAWMEALGVCVPPALAERAEKLAAQGATVVMVARDRAALGAVALVDRLRSDAPDAVARLRAQGVEVALVSGDADAAVRLVGSRAGVEHAQGGVLPEEKVVHARRWRERRGPVLAAGDGLNDAAALAAADVGVAMGSGADVTVEAADVVVRAPRLGALADLVDLARATRARIRENLGLALAYNAVAVPLAAIGLLTPVVAAVAMSASSVVVTLNSVRLLGWRARR